MSDKSEGWIISHTKEEGRSSLTPRPSYIFEIEGVRGLALTLVVLFHLFGNGRVSGGVDVFLLISGFLLTRTLMHRIQGVGGRPLVAHYGRVLTRLAPAALVVLAFVGLATWLLAPSTRWLQTSYELRASALYYQNWELIRSQLSYGAAGPDTSPLQHFWSMSVQGQFFLIWPLVMLSLAWIARRLNQSPFRWILSTTVVLTAASFTYALVLHAADQPVAYFSSFTRLWELSAGGLLALTAPYVHLPRAVRGVLGWVGISMIVSCGFLLDGGTMFPGPWTLWPLAGIAAVILASDSTGESRLARVLGFVPLSFLARISYPLYLWHWPILIFFLELRGHDRLGFRGALVVLTTSIVVSWATQQFIADPAMKLNARWSARRGLAAPLCLVLAFGLASWTAATHLEHQRQAALIAASKPSADHPGALALTSDTPTPEGVAWVPTTEAAQPDLPTIYSEKCIQNWRDEPGMEVVLTCPDNTPNPTKTVVMSGGSHVLQWYPAMRAIADLENWRLIVIDKDGCRLTSRREDGSSLSESCHKWNDQALRTIIDADPDAVFTISTKTPEVDGEEEIAFEGQVDVWNRLDEAGIPVIAVRDTPRFTGAIPDCIANNQSDPQSCARPRGDIFLPTSPILKMAEVPSSTVNIDLTDGFCTASTCAPIVGNVLAYRDQDHMTATYATTLTALLHSELEQRAPWLF